MQSMAKNSNSPYPHIYMINSLQTLGEGGEVRGEPPSPPPPPPPPIIYTLVFNLLYTC